MRIAVLGCGPAGLLAAHASRLLGAESVEVFSRRRKSEIFGAQYLHQGVPMPKAMGVISTPPVDVSYQLVGTVQQYREKVYGQGWYGAVSPEDLLGQHKAWDLRAMYNWLWGEWVDKIIDVDFAYGLPTDVTWMDYDRIYCTVPRPLFCVEEGHYFRAQEIWAAGDAPERGIFAPYAAPKNTIICNGTDAPAWYRVSNIFGYNTVEWPGWMDEPPVENVARVQKPLSTNCTCHDGAITFLGRYGAWTKSQLTHHVFRHVQDDMLEVRSEAVRARAAG